MVSTALWKAYFTLWPGISMMARQSLYRPLLTMPWDFARIKTMPFSRIRKVPTFRAVAVALALWVYLH